MTVTHIIGDVHGCATHLTDLLAALGYQENDWTGADGIATGKPFTSVT